MSTHRDVTPTACRAIGPDLPGCGTGPAGRAVFVARELAALWRELVGHGRRTPGPGTDKDT